MNKGILITSWLHKRAEDGLLAKILCIASTCLPWKGIVVNPDPWRVRKDVSQQLSFLPEPHTGDSSCVQRIWVVSATDYHWFIFFFNRQLSLIWKKVSQKKRLSSLFPNLSPAWRLVTFCPELLLGCRVSSLNTLILNVCSSSTLSSHLHHFWGLKKQTIALFFLFACFDWSNPCS